MTMKLKVDRYSLRPLQQAAQVAPRMPAQALAQPPLAPAPRAEAAPPPGTRPLIPDDAFAPDDTEDGFGDESFLPPRGGAATKARGGAAAKASGGAAAKASGEAAAKAQVEAASPPAGAGPQGQATGAAESPGAPPLTEGYSPSEVSLGEDIDAIRREGLTGRQLRIARRMAQKHELPATSDYDAVRLLRKAGIDPFGRSAVLELVQGDAPTAPPPAAAPADGSRALTVPPEARLPQTVKPVALPSTEVRAEDAHLAEVRRIQADLVARRRKRYALMWAKLAIFVFLPTLIAGWYFFAVATPMYTATSKFVIQQSTATSQLAGLFSGTSFATSQDAISVQNYLQSNDAMMRLDTDQGFREHFSAPAIDPIQRLAPDATNSAAYALYSKYVKVSYDPTEGIIGMEVSAPDPQMAVDFSTALISYAEDRVDQLSSKLRRDQEDSAKAAFDDATAKLQEAQSNLVALQTKYKTLSSEVEAGLVTGQISALDAQLMTERLALAQIQSNAQPNKARMEPVQARIKTLEDEIAKLRSGLTEGNGTDPSLASVQSDLAMATAEVATRQMMLAQATTAMETSRIEAQRQTRYLELAVRPVAPDVAAYPKAFEDTLVVMLIFLGIYLMVSMTVAILREQVSG